MNSAQIIEIATHRESSPWTVNGDLIAPPSVRYVAPQAAIDNLPPVIALTGLAGAGKSTVSAILIERGYTLVKFAGPLKAMLRALGLGDRHIEGDMKEVPHEMLCGKTPRYAMQTLGLEWGRKCIGENFWVNAWEQDAVCFPRVVVDDCRFQNEADTVRQLGGTIWRIEGRGGIAGNHESESHILAADRVIDNTGDMNALRQEVNYGLGLVN